MLDANLNLIATLEKGLQETRNVQSRLSSRLREVELEAEKLRDEIQALENSAAQTESMIDGLLVAMRSGLRSAGDPSTEKRHKDFDVPVRVQRPVVESLEAPRHTNENLSSSTVSYFSPNRGIPTRNNNIEPISHRFADRTITQACTLLLREAGAPLHVNDLYNLLVSGGMQFKGNNPTISIAVSLNRNRRFRKVEPGTFDLIMREATKRAS